MLGCYGMGKMLKSLRVFSLVLLIIISNSEAIKLRRINSKDDSCSNPNSDCARSAKGATDSVTNEAVTTVKSSEPLPSPSLPPPFEEIQTNVAIVPPRGNCAIVGEDACADKQGFEAIYALHRQLDDDANGNIDTEESVEFLRDELKYENDYERQKTFHGNDKHITVDELWKSWKGSEVHNWTVDETVKWLMQSVELPQYSQMFHEHSVNGTALPAMAVPNTHYLTNLGIKDPIHKQKIALKAMDIVLFGPQRHHNYVKDVLLVFLLLLATGGCWFAFVQHKSSQKHLRKMMRDMDSLQHAEEALREMQVELERAKRENSEMNSRLLNECSANGTGSQSQRMHDAQRGKILESDDIDVINLQASVRELEDELQSVRDELQQAESALESRAWSAPPTLQRWLQLTYEIEQRHYNLKKAAAEQQLAAAKEGCEKIRKRRSSFLGTFRIAHGSVIDDVDTWILQAKAALSEVTKDLQERVHRWRQIEVLCNTSIVQNPGIVRLEAMLRGNHHAPNGNVINAAAKVLGNSVRSSPISRSCSEGTLLEDELATGAAPYPTISAGSSLVHLGPPYLNSTSPQHSLQQQLNTSNLHSQIPLRPNALGVTSTLHHPLHQLEEEAATEDEVDNGELDYYYEDQRNAKSPPQSPDEGVRPVFSTGRSDNGSPTSIDGGFVASGITLPSSAHLRSRVNKGPEQRGQMNSDLVSLSCSESALEVSTTSESSSSVAATPSSTSSSIGVSQQTRHKKISSGSLASAFKNSVSGGGSSVDEADTDSSSEKARKKSSSILSKLKRKSKAH